MEPDVLQGKAGKEQVQKRQDRLVSFFDAIVAVGITMIVMGIALPEADMEPWELVVYIGSEVTVYLVSFVALAELWRVHHAIFSYFESVADEKVTNAHIALMFLVTIFPFLTRFMNAYQNVTEIRILYVGSYVVMNLLMVLIVYLANKRHVQNRLEEEDKIKKWIPLMLAQKMGGRSDEQMKEIAKYSAMFQSGTFSGRTFDKTSAFTFDEGMRESMKAMGLWEEENPNAKRAKSIQAIISITLNFISVTLSVILLMVNPLFCYIVFLAKFILDAICGSIVEFVLVSSGEGRKTPGSEAESLGNGREPSGNDRELSGNGHESLGNGREPSGNGHEPLGNGHEPSGSRQESSVGGHMAHSAKEWVDLWKEEQRRKGRERKRVNEHMQKEREDARKARQREREDARKARENMRGGR